MWEILAATMTQYVVVQIKSTYFVLMSSLTHFLSYISTHLKSQNKYNLLLFRLFKWKVNDLMQEVCKRDDSIILDIGEKKTKFSRKST